MESQRVSRALEALYATGHWLYEQARFRDAACVFRAMLAVNPLDERPWLALGLCHEKLDGSAAAAELYFAACLTLKHAPRCHLARSRLLRAAGRDAEADDAIAAATRIAEQLEDDELFALARAEGGAS